MGVADVYVGQSVGCWLVNMMIKFFLLVTNQGQPRIRKYYDYPDEELHFEPELIKKCLTRNEHLVP